MRTWSWCLVVLPVAAFAQNESFDAANKYLSEQSYSKACDGFEAFLKANAQSPLAREATAKRALACWKVGKSNGNTVLSKLADSGEQDFTRAYAQWALSNQGYRQFQQALPLLIAATKSEGRQGSEARALLISGCLAQLDNSTWDPRQAEKLTDIVLANTSNETDKAHARFDRAQAWLRNQQTQAKADEELASVGAGSTSWADDALFALGQRRESQERYLDALAQYDTVTKRFSSTTSNQFENARSAAQTIRQPTLSVSSYQIALPGLKVPVQLSWRNISKVSWTLRRVDPFAPKQNNNADSADGYAGSGTLERSWEESVEVKSQHAPGNRQFDLEVPGPGLYVVEVVSGSLRARDFVVLSPLAIVAKSDHNQVQVFVANAETGQAVADAEVMLFPYSRSERPTGKTSALGLATIPAPDTSSTIYVWVKRGKEVAFSHAGNSSWSSASRTNLAYVLLDRPLYKPGETVGLKLYLRSREMGPSEPLANQAATVSLYDPTGKETKFELITNAFGTAHATFAIPKTAPLGQWSIQARSSNVSYQQPSMWFRVEEFKPPEATVSVSAVGNASPGQPAKLKVTAKYYSGGPLAGAQGRAIVTVMNWTHRFGPWPDTNDADDPNDGDEDDGREYRRRRYRGDDDEYRWYGPSASYTLTFKTGSDGTAELEVPATQDSGSDQQITAQVFVTDASRREVQGTGGAKLSRRPYFVDVRSDHLLYRPGEKVTLRLRAEDPNGRPASADVLVRLSRITDSTTGTSSAIAEARSRIVDGRGVVQLDADALGAVRVDVLEVDAKQSLATTDLWLTSDTKPVPPPGPGFQLLTDHAPISVGQPLRVLVVTPEPGGHVWLTLEHELVVASKVVELTGRTKYVELIVPNEATPNAWLTVNRFEKGAVLRRNASVSVRGSDVTLDVGVAFDRAVAEPGASVPVRVTARKAPGPTETALTIVDEALFSIEPERQDFLPFFGRARRNQWVRTHTTTDWRTFRPRPVAVAQATPNRQAPADSPKDAARDEEAKPSAKSAMAPPSPVMAAPEAEAGRRSSADRENKKSKEDDSSEADDRGPVGAAAVKPRTDFGSSAGWYASLNGTAAPLTQQIKVTDSLTSWKAIATVVTQGPHLGRGSSSMRTALPLMVRLQTPRFLIEGDEVVLSAVIESHLPKTGPVEVSISVPGLKPLGATRQTITVTPEQVSRFDARFKVLELGDHKVRAQVKAGSAADAMELTVPALVHGSAQRQFFAGRLSDKVHFEFELPEKRKATLTKLELNLSPSVLAVMLDGLPYLAQYPYGCVEQTLSRFVPAVIARRTAKEAGLPVERLPANLDDMVSKGLERLTGFQHSDGGWGWWRDDRTNLWMTAYVIYALGLSKEAGLTIDASMLARGRAYLLSHLGEALDTPDTHAFAAYALAQSGPVPKAVLDQLFERRTKLEPRGRALVALTLITAKDSRARVAVDNLDDVVKVAQSRPDAAVGEANDAWSTSAAIEATAYTLMAMARWPDGAKYLGPLTDFLVLRRNGGKWRTTRDTAFAIYALSELARREKAATSQGSFTVEINGKRVKQVSFSRGGLDVPAITFADGDFKPGKNVVEVKRDGAGTGYWAATWDVFNQNDFIKGVGGDVTVKRSYTLLGKPSHEQARAPTEYGMPVESGVRVRVDLELTANKAVEFVMLEDLKPAGFEAVQQRSGPEVCAYACAHAELRTDRVAMFLPELRVGTTKLSYELRAEVPGRFSALPARAEAMYAPEIQATADEMRFEVRDAPTTGVAAQ